MCEQSGYDISRVVGLNDLLAKHLTCSICAAIMKDPMDTKCKHTFCSQCIHRWLTDQNTCPVCRRVLTIRRSTRAQLSSPMTAPELEPNILAQNIINDLKYKCYTESNGCQQPIELGSLSAHLDICEQYLCGKCGLKMGRASEHDCLTLMRNKMKKYKKSLQICKNDKDLIEKQLIECKRKVAENNSLQSNPFKRLRADNELCSDQNRFYVREDLQIEKTECFLERVYKRIQIDEKAFIRLLLIDESSEDLRPRFAVRMKPNAKFDTLLACMRDTVEYRDQALTIKKLCGQIVSTDYTPAHLGLKHNDSLKLSVNP